MIKLIKTEEDSRIIQMYEMKPLQVGVLQSGSSKGHYVVRTASETNFEVMDISDAGIASCWTGCPELKVRLLNKDEKVKLELFNEE